MTVATAETAALSKRFLLRFSYIGTRYQGVQRQSPRTADTVEHTTVQGALERAFDQTLKLPYSTALSVSSRTDRHVHAHRNSAHFELLPFPPRDIDVRGVTHRVNRFLRKYKHDVVLRQIIRVPCWFHSRSDAQRRKYVYRVGFLKDLDADINDKLPLSQHNRSLLVNQKVDIEQVQRACELFQGFRDFRAFRKSSGEGNETKKHMEEVTFVPDHNRRDDCEFSEHYTWWKFNIVARSFLYKQIRRMVATALCVGKGTIPLEKLRDRLEKPHLYQSCRDVQESHGHGLYLVDVEYDTKYFKVDLPAPCWKPKVPYMGKKPQDARHALSTKSTNKEDMVI